MTSTIIRKLALLCPEAVVPLYYRCGSPGPDNRVEFLEDAVANEFRF